MTRWRFRLRPRWRVQVHRRESSPTGWRTVYSWDPIDVVLHRTALRVRDELRSSNRWGGPGVQAQVTVTRIGGAQ